MVNEKNKKKRRRSRRLFFIECIITAPIIYLLTVSVFTFIKSTFDDTNNDLWNMDIFKSYLNDKMVILCFCLIYFLVFCYLLYTYLKIVILNPTKVIEKYQTSSSDVLGDARFMTKEEMVEKFGKKKKKLFKTKYEYYKLDKNNSYKLVSDNPSGWLIASKIYKHKYQYLMYSHDVNVVTIGSPGTGKTQYFLLPNIIANARSKDKPMMIINDVKGELFEQSSEMLHELGYDVRQINLREERKSARINPLKTIWDTFQFYTTSLKIKLLKIDTGEVFTQEIELNKNGNSIKLYEDLFININKNDYSKLQFSSKSYKFKESKNDVEYYENDLEIENEANTFTVYDDNEIPCFKLSIFKKSEYIDKATTEILTISHTFIPEGSGESQGWNAGSRGILEGCLWGMLEDSLHPEYEMNLNKFTIANIGSIINKMSYKTLAEWLKSRDKISSKSREVAAMIVDNPSEKTVASYISNTQTLLKPYLTSGIAYITSYCDFEYNELVDNKKPVALFITIPDENNVKFPIASLYIKQLYIFLIDKASKMKSNHLERKVYFYLDEFAQMPKFEDFSKWINASRSRWIYFNIIIQSVTQLDGTYQKDNARSILNGCQLHIFLGASDDETVRYFYNKLGKETVITNDISMNKEATATGNYISGQRLQSKELVTMNKLSEIHPGNIYFSTLGEPVAKANLIPYFNSFCQKSGIFKIGFIDTNVEEKEVNEHKNFYNIEDVIKKYQSNELANELEQELGRNEEFRHNPFSSKEEYLKRKRQKNNSSIDNKKPPKDDEDLISEYDPSVSNPLADDIYKYMNISNNDKKKQESEDTPEKKKNWLQ